MLSWMKYWSLDKSVYFNDKVESVQVPIIPAIPALSTVSSNQPVNGKTNTPEATASGLGGLQSFINTTQASVTENAVEATQTIAANNIACGIQTFTSACQEVQSNFQSDNQKALQDFVSKVKKSNDNLQTHQFTGEVLYFRSLYLASTQLMPWCTDNGIANCALIIFSNMYDMPEVQDDTNEKF